MISCLFKFLSFRLTFQVYLQTIPRKYMKTSKFAFSICFFFVFSSFTINSLNYICVILKLIYYSSDPTHAFLVPNNECSCVRVCFFVILFCSSRELFSWMQQPIFVLVAARKCYQYFQKQHSHSWQHLLCSAVLGVHSNRPVVWFACDKSLIFFSMPQHYHRYDVSMVHQLPVRGWNLS